MENLVTGVLVLLTAMPGAIREQGMKGSAQQFVRVCILRGFLESDEFGLSGSQALRL
jgi:hypothetical protein